MTSTVRVWAIWLLCAVLVDFRQGLKNTIDWYRQHIASDNCDSLSANASR